MGSKINVRMILEAKFRGFTNNAIAFGNHMSKHSVQMVVGKGTAMGILPHGTILDVSDEELYRLFFPDRWQYESIYTLPDYALVHSEHNRTGVTLKMLHKEYVVECKEHGKLHIGWVYEVLRRLQRLCRQEGVCKPYHP